MGACIYDNLSPCEHCGRCNKAIYREVVDEENNDVYHLVSYNGGYTWEEE